MRVNDLAETIGDADALARRGPPAKCLTGEFPCLDFMLHSIPDTPPLCSNTPVGNLDQPVAEQIKSVPA